MRRRWVTRAVLSAAAVGLVLPAAACSGGGRRGVAAVVAGEEIRAEAADALVGRYLKGASGDAAAGELSRAEIRRVVLTYLIKVSYLERLAADLSIRDTPSPVESEAARAVPESEYATVGWRADDYDRSLRAGRLSRAMAQQLFPSVPVADDDVRALYRARSSVFERSWKATVKVAYFRDAAPARALRDRLGRGEAFEAAAAALGAVEAGSLGDVTPSSSLPAPLLEAVAALPERGAGEPLAVGGMWACPFVEHRQDLPALSFDAVQADLSHELQDQKRQELFNTWFTKKLTSAGVRVSGAFGHWDPALPGVAG